MRREIRDAAPRGPDRGRRRKPGLRFSVAFPEPADGLEVERRLDRLLHEAERLQLRIRAFAWDDRIEGLAEGTARRREPARSLRPRVRALLAAAAPDGEYVVK